MKGLLYAMVEVELEKMPEPPKKFNIYGDY